jgi:transposase
VLLALVPVNRVDDLFDLLNGQCVVIDRYFNPEDVVVIDASGQLVAKRRIPESVAGFAELTAVLADAGEDPDDPIPVAIETPRGLLVAVLRATGRQIYPINPMSVARYRERTSMSGNKSDHADAVTLANIVRTDADRHRPLSVDTELAQSITVLAIAPTPATAARLSKPQIVAALRRAGRQRGLTTLAATIQQQLRLPQLRQPKLVEDAFDIQALAVLATLNAECASVDRLGEAVAAAFTRHPDYRAHISRTRHPARQCPLGNHENSSAAPMNPERATSHTF